jgi:ribosomal protein L32
MWKSDISLRAPTIFSPQANCGISKLIHTLCVENFSGDFHRNFPQLIFPHSTAAVENFLGAETSWTIR